MRIENKEECKPPAQERLTHTDVELTIRLRRCLATAGQACQPNDIFSEHRLVTLERFGGGGSCSESLRGVEAPRYSTWLKGTPGGAAILGCGRSPR